MAKPYREGAGWCARRRYRGHDIYVSGKETKAAAEKEVRQRVAAIDAGGKPQHLGPKRTTLAYALQEFGFEHLPHLKGAPQEVRRINRYLESAGVQSLVVVPAPVDSTMHYEVSLRPVGAQRKVPQGLSKRRKFLLNKTASADRIRLVLAQTPVANITRLDVQRLIDALAQAGQAPATIALERALLRRFFKHARSKWSWAQPADNPATELSLPKVDNERDRVLSREEEVRLDAAFDEALNVSLRHVVVLLRETAMRASEPLLHATWSSVDWENKLLKLSDGKDGKRDVPLSPTAIDALKALGPGEPHQRIVEISYEALKAGFRRACKRAKVENFHLHDLRHTAATRLGLATGNQYLVKALTGHKTDVMVKRYVNVKASDVVDFLHRKDAEAPDERGEQAVSDSPSLPAPVAVSVNFEEARVQELIASTVREAVAKAMSAANAPAQEAASRFAESNVIELRRAAA